MQTMLPEDFSLFYFDYNQVFLLYNWVFDLADLQVIFFNTTHNLNEAGNVSVATDVCNLHKYTEYTVNVQMMPIDGGFWSEESLIKATTNSSGKLP